MEVDATRQQYHIVVSMQECCQCISCILNVDGKVSMRSTIHNDQEFYSLPLDDAADAIQHQRQSFIASSHHFLPIPLYNLEP